MAAEHAGLQVYYSADLACLADHLLQLLAHLRQDAPLLQMQTVVVGDIAMARWLQDRMAHCDGIAAGVEYVLLSVWLEREFERIDQDFSSTSINADVLRMAIFAELTEQSDAFAAPDFVVPNSTSARLRLADQLAQLFSQYLIYRADWILGWEDETPTRFESHWQSTLWRRVMDRIRPAKHRARQFSALLSQQTQGGAAALATPNKKTESLAPALFFGVSHLPPDVLQWLDRRAQQSLVAIYFPNPCYEYWADLPKAQLRATDFSEPEAEVPYSNRLLSTLGTQGQAFLSALLNYTDQFYELLPSPSDTTKPTRSVSKLTALQQGIRHLQPSVLDGLQCEADTSIHLIAASTATEELLQLKGYLQAQLAAQHDLHLEDIIVLSPNLAGYRELLPGTFGDGAALNVTLGQIGVESKRQLPYSIWGRNLGQAHPWLATLVGIFTLPERRFGVQDMQQYFQSAALLRSLGLQPLFQAARQSADADAQRARDQLNVLIKELPTGFALDNWHRMHQLQVAASEGAGETTHARSEQTWQLAIDRLMFGFLQGTIADQHSVEPHPAWPDIAMGPDQRGLVAGLAQLVAQLRRIAHSSVYARTPDAWADWAVKMTEPWHRHLYTDEEREVWQCWLSLLQRWRDACAAAHLYDLVDAHLVAQSFTGWLSEEACSMRPQFVGTELARGGICFSPMVPMRSRPFRVVCLLGINAQNYPRADPERDLDLMQQDRRRLLDRSVNADDRYLFLESINAAIDQLVICYRNTSAIDGQPLEVAMPLAELIDQMRRQFPSVTPCKSNMPLQKQALATGKMCFDPDHFQPLTMPFSLRVDELLSFIQRPFLHHVIQVMRLKAPQRAISDFATNNDAEHLSALLPAAWLHAPRLLRMALYLGQTPECPPAWLRAHLPPGDLGLASYQELCDQLNAQLDVPANLRHLCIGTQPQTVPIDLRIGSRRLVGAVPDCHLDSHTLWRLGHRVPNAATQLKTRFLLACLCLQSGHTRCQSLAWPSDDKTLKQSFPSLQCAADYVQAWLDCYEESHTRPICFWPGHYALWHEQCKNSASPKFFELAQVGLSKDADHELEHWASKVILPGAAFVDAADTRYLQMQRLGRSIWDSWR